ncbi:hypothetical protein [Paraburkholderia youngii]|uniref:hypothetical protein n=1 Tax=Paraburkholderia youngii TaxID=2782701 RepID=UPI003D1FB19C
MVNGDSSVCREQRLARMSAVAQACCGIIGIAAGRTDGAQKGLRQPGHAHGGGQMHERAVGRANEGGRVLAARITIGKLRRYGLDVKAPRRALTYRLGCAADGVRPFASEPRQEIDQRHAAVEQWPPGSDRPFLWAIRSAARS